jgi:hypothetical protein
MSLRGQNFNFDAGILIRAFIGTIYSSHARFAQGAKPPTSSLRLSALGHKFGDVFLSSHFLLVIEFV